MNAPARNRFPLLALPLLLAPLAATAPENAAAQGILKCKGADGTTIFTDESCEAFGARLEKDFAFESGENQAPGQLREPPQNATDDGFVGTGFAIKGCARSQGELMAGVRDAISRGDVNRLSNYYHWTGMSSSAAFATMDRLDKIARNTMASVAYDYPMPSYDYAEPYYSSNTTPAMDEATTTASLSAAVAVAAMAPSERPSWFDAYRGENDDVAYNSGLVDASTPLAEAKPSVPAVEAASSSTAVGGTNALLMLGGSVDASTPLSDARSMTMANVSGSSYAGGYNPKPSAMRVNLGGGTGQHFRLRQTAGCWFISF